MRQYFNPRSPHGERRASATLGFSVIYFNPRSPHGERRIARTAAGIAFIFQSTPPAWGATFVAMRTAWRLSIFQSTPPHGERLLLSEPSLPQLNFNPRPRMGSDDDPSRHTRGYDYFNPRPPHGERQASVMLALSVSIFQSTLPA